MVYDVCRFLKNDTNISTDETSRLLHLVEASEETVGQLACRIRGYLHTVEWSVDRRGLLTVSVEVW